MWDWIMPSLRDDGLILSNDAQLIIREISEALRSVDKEAYERGCKEPPSPGLWVARDKYIEAEQRGLERAAEIIKKEYFVDYAEMYVYKKIADEIRRLK